MIPSRSDGVELHFEDVPLSNNDGTNILSLYAKKDGMPIGSLTARYDAKDFLIADIRTPEYCRRQGLGVLKIREALKYLESKNLKPARVFGCCVASAGEPFYEALGFSRIGDSDNWEVSCEELRKKL